MATDSEVYCTLVLNDRYLPGAAVLARSLRDTGTTRKLAAMVTLDSLESDTLDELKSLYDFIIPVDCITNPLPRNLHLLDRPDLLYSFTKINLWRQTQFKKIIYVDADMLALRAPDELFDLNVDVAAAPDIGWPDIFNTGLMVIKPNVGDFWALQNLASSGDSFDGADQGLINQYFEHKNWHRLSFRYNVTPSGNYQYDPAYRYYKALISMVHYIGPNKPWIRGRARTNESGSCRELINSWWAVYDRYYRLAPEDHTAAASGPRAIQRLTNDELAITVPKVMVTTTELPMTESGNVAEEIAKGNVDPTSTLEQRQYSAPMAEWDATRAPPPVESQPEAANFPKTTYEFNHSTDLFKPPQSYPDPPSNLHYQVPDSGARHDQHKAIFPWEEREPVQATRVFNDDFGTPEKGFKKGEDGEATKPEPTTPRITVSLDDETAKKHDKFRRNAWDEIPEIDDFVRRYSQMQQLRGSLQVLSQTVDKQPQSPSDETDPATPPTKQSMVVTDFPSATERPSLPVTPAPIRRNMFWGSERNDKGDLPSAKGVPSQAEWDPTSKLEELRLSSLNMSPTNLTLPSKNVPKRDMPGSAMTQFGGPLVSGANASPEHHVHFASGTGGDSPSPSPTPRRSPSNQALRSTPSFGSIEAGPTKQASLSPPKNVSPTRRMPTRGAVRGGS